MLLGRRGGPHGGHCRPMCTQVPAFRWFLHADMPRFRRHGGDSRASPPSQSWERYPIPRARAQPQSQPCKYPRSGNGGAGALCARSHALPHPIAVPCTTQQRRCTPASPLCPASCFAAFSSDAPRVCLQTAGAVGSRPPTRSSCPGPAPLAFAEFTCAQPGPPPVCLRAPSRLLAHRALLVQLQPPARGCSCPRTHSHPLPPSVQPPAQRAALWPVTLPRGLTLRFGGPDVPHLQTTAVTPTWSPSAGPAHCSLTGPALREASLLCPHGALVLLATGKVPQLQGEHGDQSTGGC